MLGVPRRGPVLRWNPSREAGMGTRLRFIHGLEEIIVELAPGASEEARERSARLLPRLVAALMTEASPAQRRTLLRALDEGAVFGRVRRRVAAGRSDDDMSSIREAL